MEEDSRLWKAVEWTLARMGCLSISTSCFLECVLVVVLFADAEGEAAVHWGGQGCTPPSYCVTA